MNLEHFGLDVHRKTVVILGAGATRGASFVSAWAINKPPLDGDYFANLRNSDIATSPRVQRLLDFIEEEFGTLSVGMEDFYSQATVSGEFIKEVPADKRRHSMFDRRLKDFMATLAPFLGCAVADQACAYHKQLAENLGATDAIVSFNYDCVMDRALIHAGRRWLPDRGYGVAATDWADWCDHTGRGRPAKTGIRLLKPHGSLNWSPNGNGVSLLGAEYEERDEPMVVPPLWQKRFDSAPYLGIWEQVRRVLSTARALVVVGYSLPATDVYSSAALRTDVGALDLLVIANPDSTVRQSIQRAIRTGISARTRIVELESLRDLAQALGYRDPVHYA